MPAKAGTHDMFEILQMFAVGPGLRRDDENGTHLIVPKH
jgi:hypothetical protein